MSKEFIKCKLTGKEGFSVDSHIIPRAFYNLYDADNNFKDGGFTGILKNEIYSEKKNRIGVYDQNIVTAEGEDMFKECDTYAAEFFLQGHDKKKWLQSADNQDIYTLSPDQFNSDLIRRFCMTLLWRAHTSTHPFFENVNIGPHETRLRKLILENDVGCPRDFSIILSGWNNLNICDWPVLAPKNIRSNGLNYYRFDSCGLVFVIKVDSRPFPSEGLESVVGGSANLVMLMRSFTPTKNEHELINRMTSRHK